ncbi:MAG: hypothetical protein ABL904_02140 [Hyphomicrobiaceae bacterium]
MANRPTLEAVRKTFADITGALEDAALLASEAQAAPDQVAARKSCDRLIAAGETCLGRLHHLRRRLA